MIHRNIEEALKATGIVQGEDTLNRNAKSAALSAFEGTKQRFCGHLLTGMKCPSLIRAVEADLDAGRSAVVQLVSTGEALMERRIAEISASEWDDLNIDLTPRDGILSFLMHAFPVQLQEPFTDDDGNLMSRPATDADGNPVICREAEEQRDALIEKLAALPPVPTALDQVVQHFGHEAVAEVTGRSRRVLRITDAKGERLALRSRPASANLAETAAFMDGTKRILVFSMAGGTGRSYPADLSCENTERRIHYLLEPGWRADQAIQGLGRTHRTHQASASLFRPVTTDVKGERRFIATIARRLDSLGAITRGQRDSQTAMGGSDAALFRESDNLESAYAKAALRQFYSAFWRGRIEGWNMERFQDSTGLKIVHEGGCCSARGLRADRHDKLLKLFDTGGQNCTPNNRLWVRLSHRTETPWWPSLHEAAGRELSNGVSAEEACSLRLERSGAQHWRRCAWSQGSLCSGYFCRG